MKLNEGVVKALASPAKGNRVTFFPDAMVQGATVPRGFGVRVTAAGVKAFILDYRHKGRQHRITLGRWPDWSALRAAHYAREVRQKIDRGENPMDARKPEPAVVTVGVAFDRFMLDPHTKTLRTAERYRDSFDRLAKPVIGAIAIHDLKRSHITAMLDRIEAEHGASAAHHVLAHVRIALRWYALRDDDFVPPFAPGMSRTSGTERARSRILSDDEIRAVWPVLDRIGTLGPIAKILLLTGQRRNEVAQMVWNEIEADLWTIPAARYKTKRDQYVPLTDAAMAVIRAQPHRNDTPFVFPSERKVTPYGSFSKGKRRLDRLAPIPPWSLHDLRRTARSLMARAGVADGVAERVLGHVVPGVRGVYDRHSYAAEKRDALEKLAAMIERILEPTQSNIASLSERRAGGTA